MGVRVRVPFPGLINMFKNNRKSRYKLHWNANGEIKAFKWVIYDWKFKTPIAYHETRQFARLICWYYNVLDNADKSKLQK